MKEGEGIFYCINAKKIMSLNMREIVEDAISDPKILEMVGKDKPEYMVSLIDLIEFFDDKYRNIGRTNFGVGATSIITTKQMIEKLNECNNMEKAQWQGAHEDQRDELDRIVFNLPQEYNSRNIESLNLLTKSQRKQLRDRIWIRFQNCPLGNFIHIKFSEFRNTFTTNEIRALKLLYTRVQCEQERISKPVKISILGDNYKGKKIEEVLKDLELHKDDTYASPVSDEKIIATSSIETIEKKYRDIIKGDTCL